MNIDARIPYNLASMFTRLFKAPKQSFFLFGARQTGKSTWIKALLGKNSWYVDLLQEKTYWAFSKNPGQFRAVALDKIENGTTIIAVDEIQRIPDLLNEIHSLMESHKKCQWILTGSSARKLKRGQANLLAGRAVHQSMFPLTFWEMGKTFNLESVLRWGSLPAVAVEPEAVRREILRTYAQTYLREEIQQEALVRNVGAFSRFLDVAASQNGELVSYSKVASECQIPQRTVQSYYQILEDTLIAYRLEPMLSSIRKRLVAHPRYYFFDLGVTNALNHCLTGELTPVQKGRLFEQWVVLECWRRISYAGSELELRFWRTNHGAEVDLVFQKHGKVIAACEIKYKNHIRSADTTGLQSFAEQNPKAALCLIYPDENAFSLGNVKVIPWKKFFQLFLEWL